MPTQKAVFYFKAPIFISALIAEFDYKLLAAQNGKVAELEGMLLELKEHEQRNTALLETLMDHLQQNGFVHSNDRVPEVKRLVHVSHNPHSPFLMPSVGSEWVQRGPLTVHLLEVSLHSELAE